MTTMKHGTAEDTQKLVSLFPWPADIALAVIVYWIVLHQEYVG
jgi:hypothetical protein